MRCANDNSKVCRAAFVQDSTLVVVIEMALTSWLVAGMIPGVDREPLKKIAPDPEELLQLLYRWRDEAIKAGKEITRIAVAYETGRDSFWLARWLRARGIDAHVIHATSVAISREHRRAKTDRIDTAMLRRGFLGWLRGEPGHCSLAIVPTFAEEDAKRPHRERESLVQERTSWFDRLLGRRRDRPKRRWRVPGAAGICRDRAAQRFPDAVQSCGPYIRVKIVVPGRLSHLTAAFTSRHTLTAHTVCPLLA
jgi:transposase